MLIAAGLILLFLGSAFLFARIYRRIYRTIPEIRVEWSEVAIGSIITASLFVAGKVLIGIYLRTAAPKSRWIPSLEMDA